MKYAFKYLFLLLVVFASIGCTNNNVLSRSNTSADSIVGGDLIEGGENGKIRGHYHFKDYNDFISFYAQFKEKNTERYLAPPDSNIELNFNYSFLSEGIEKHDFEEQNYNILFPNQTMYVNIANGSESLFGKCIDVQLFAINELTYEVKNNNQFSIIDTSGNKVYTASFDSTSNASISVQFCKLVLEEFKKGGNMYE